MGVKMGVIMDIPKILLKRCVFGAKIKGLRVFCGVAWGNSLVIILIGFRVYIGL